jgi:hypothetical protein
MARPTHWHGPGSGTLALPGPARRGILLVSALTSNSASGGEERRLWRDGVSTAAAARVPALGLHVIAAGVNPDDLLSGQPEIIAWIDDVDALLASGEAEVGSHIFKVDVGGSGSVSEMRIFHS